MLSDITIIPGSSQKPALVFIHGLGMDKKIWESPAEAKILGGRFPITVLLCKEPGPAEQGGTEQSAGLFSLGTPPPSLATLFHDALHEGYSVIAWSQQRPAGEIAHAVAELHELVAECRTLGRRGFILIGHSRGGLIARKYLHEKGEGVRAIVTLGTPHRGSRMASWVEYLSPLGAFIDTVLPEADRGSAAFAVKRVAQFLKSRASRELLPDSVFYRSCYDLRREGIRYVSIGGSNPTLVSLYRNVSGKAGGGGQQKTILRPQKVFSFPDLLLQVVPERFFPEEMKKGRGDCLVSVESSRIPWADEHHVFAVNHAEILFDPGARATVMVAIRHVADATHR